MRNTLQSDRSCMHATRGVHTHRLCPNEPANPLVSASQ